MIYFVNKDMLQELEKVLAIKMNNKDIKILYDQYNYLVNQYLMAKFSKYKIKSFAVFMILTYQDLEMFKKWEHSKDKIKLLDLFIRILANEIILQIETLITKENTLQELQNLDKQHTKLCIELYTSKDKDLIDLFRFLVSHLETHISTNY